MNKKTEQALEKFVAELQQGAITAQELTAVVHAVTNAIVNLRQDINNVETTLQSDYTRSINKLDSALTALRARLTDLAERQELKDINDQIKKYVDNEVSKVRFEIPLETDLTDIYQKIQDVRNLIPTLPPEKLGEDYRNALEALPDGDKLSIDAIENLSEELDKIRKLKTAAPSGGGGGINVSHIPRHEEFTMDGIATTVSLLLAPAAAGMAIFACRYQGQVLNYSTQYTVDGNKITLVGFTPESGTIISVTYMP